MTLAIGLIISGGKAFPIWEQHALYLDRGRTDRLEEMFVIVQLLEVLWLYPLLDEETDP
jgi:hypothetical protein